MTLHERLAERQYWFERTPAALVRAWNTSFHPKRREAIQRMLRHGSCDKAARGRGNRAWKRARALFNDPAVIVWPDYALGIVNSVVAETVQCWRSR